MTDEQVLEQIQQDILLIRHKAKRDSDIALCWAEIQATPLVVVREEGVFVVCWCRRLHQVMLIYATRGLTEEQIEQVRSGCTVLKVRN